MVEKNPGKQKNLTTSTTALEMGGDHRSRKTDLVPHFPGLAAGCHPGVIEGFSCKTSTGPLLYSQNRATFYLRILSGS
ncbi:hypothetical protein DSLASN_05810 [Desulfoluna limicola]|uniref:Uncharacterized protein n=1 Tax=Desulfoluna limicola TaxID=2810562 RepID=A0ABN6EZ48_9BACT|nr:hypothetical protein DSLASN_05810 [Desulfoluna limicola]